MKKHLGTIKHYLCNYNLPLLSTKSSGQIEQIYANSIQPLNIRARFLARECLDIWKNAIIFQKIQTDHGCVWEFISSCLNPNTYDVAHSCYVHPDTKVIDSFFVDVQGQYKLWGVGYTIVREFYNNIGIDDFKPDGNIVRVFGSIGVHGYIAGNRLQIRQKGQVSRQSPKKMRQIGIEIATMTRSQRKYVDSLLWHFGREICKQATPGCAICDLKKSGIC